MTTQMLNFIAITINVIVYVPYFIFVFVTSIEIFNLSCVEQELIQDINTCVTHCLF